MVVHPGRYSFLGYSVFGDTLHGSASALEVVARGRTSETRARNPISVDRDVTPSGNCYSASVCKGGAAAGRGAWRADEALSVSPPVVSAKRGQAALSGSR